MLQTLRIKNLALVEDLTWELGPSLNIITGETGAGKSVIVGALNLLLGERAEKSLIRSGAETCTVEAVIAVEKELLKNINVLMEESGLEPCAESQLLVKRTFTATGPGKQFINGSPATLQVLKKLGEWLVDIHGPHDHQSLLSNEKQQTILDAYAGLSAEVLAFGKEYEQRQNLIVSRQGLSMSERELKQEVDRLNFVVQEIEAAGFKLGEDETVEAEYKVASNSSRVIELSRTVVNAFNEGDTPIFGQLAFVQKTLQELVALDSRVVSFSEVNARLIEEFTGLRDDIGRYAEKRDNDESRLSHLAERISLIQTLKRKYGNSIEEINRVGAEARDKLKSLQSRDEEMARLGEEILKAERKMTALGAEISKKRALACPKLTKAISTQLHDLGFKQAGFEINLVTSADTWKTTGFDAIDFLFAPNPGEPAKPLKSIASSGEIARVMLAIKTVLAEEDTIPILVFDEVDANIGGEVAVAIGEKMAGIATKHQVLCISHLPQVASFAKDHFVVVKEVKNNRTFSLLHHLEGKARVEELARMLGGQSKSALDHAKELLKKAGQ